jgi:simple sugar transport system ATP-binding protein
MQYEYTLQMKNIQKEYYGNKVLKGVDLMVKPGEIHALLGENGAGKSTLMNILFGMPVIHSTGGFQGDVHFCGEATLIKSPEDAMERGIGMVHQEFMLIPDFTIAENIKLNREISRHNVISTTFKNQGLEFLDYKAMNADARKSLDTLGMNIDEWVKVAGLPVGHMQFVEIAREIDKEGIKLLVFDEPTAVLTESEAENLIAAMKRLTATGISILFITHRLDEVINAADNITILRDGELVATLPKEGTNVLELAALMVGREIEVTQKEEEEEKSGVESIMSIKDLHVDMPGEEVKGIDLEIKKGEILGIAGLAGQGKIGVANGILGLYPAKGQVIMEGQDLKLNDTHSVLEQGLSFVSEDRRAVGLLLDSSIEDNIMMTTMQVKQEFLKSYGLFKLADAPRIRKHANDMIELFDIRCTGPLQPTRRLSGGNQQKVCLARALTLEPKVLFVSEPTRGIDIGAKKLVLDMLVERNKKDGMTVVVTSSELAELRSVCDRIAVIAEGRLEGILKPNDSDADFGLMMSGEYHKFHNKNKEDK